MKKVSGLRKILTGGAIGLATLAGSLYESGNADAGMIRWSNRVPVAESNPNNIGSYETKIEIGNGGTINYDSGIDVDLIGHDPNSVTNDKSFISYVYHEDPKKVEHERTQNLGPGESYISHLSFENNGGGGTTITQNTIEFLAADGNFTYDLKVNKNDSEEYNYFVSGDVVLGELTPWFQGIFPGQDHRNTELVGFPNGWYYGELTITNVSESADFNNNTYVDGNDFLAWQRGFGETGLPGSLYSQGDANGDGVVDGSDLDVWQSQYGTTVSPAIASSAVPEPTTSCLALAALFLTFGNRRSR